QVIMDPVMKCTTLPSHSKSLKRFLFHFSRRFNTFYWLSHSEIVDIEKVAVRSSLRVPNIEGSVDGVTTSLQLSQNLRPPMLDQQDKYMMKAQVHVSKSSAISDIQSLPQRKHYCQIYQVVKHMLRGRLLASFQDHELEGGDTRS
nr:hypothetical protein [Tanacetum cinerariifolium]